MRPRVQVSLEQQQTLIILQLQFDKETLAPEDLHVPAHRPARFIETLTPAAQS